MKELIHFNQSNHNIRQGHSLDACKTKDKVWAQRANHDGFAKKIYWYPWQHFTYDFEKKTTMNADYGVLNWSDACFQQGSVGHPFLASQMLFSVLIFMKSHFRRKKKVSRPVWTNDFAEASRPKVYVEHIFCVRFCIFPLARFMSAW